jgi:hypothetical protein
MRVRDKNKQNKRVERKKKNLINWKKKRYCGRSSI